MSIKERKDQHSVENDEMDKQFVCHNDEMHQQFDCHAHSVENDEMDQQLDCNAEIVNPSEYSQELVNDKSNTPVLITQTVLIPMLIEIKKAIS